MGIFYAFLMSLMSNEMCAFGIKSTFPPLCSHIRQELQQLGPPTLPALGTQHCYQHHCFWSPQKLGAAATTAITRKKFSFYLCFFESPDPDQKSGAGDGTSQVVQWLGLCAPNAGGPGSIPGQGTRSCMMQLKILHAATKIPCATSKTQ